MIFLFSGVMFKFHLNFQGCFPPKLKTKLNVTLTLHFGEGIAFLFLANSMKFHLCKLPVATVRFPLADMPLFLPSLVSHQGFQQSCAWEPFGAARVPYVM